MREKTWVTWAGLAVLVIGLTFLIIVVQPYIGSVLASIPTAPPLVVSTSTAMATATPTTTFTPVPTKQQEELLDEALTPEPEATATPVPPSPTPTPVPTGEVPVQLIIEDIRLDAPVLPIGWIYTESDGQRVPVWDVPDEFAVGWHNTSAKLGIAGNTVLNGHNTNNGEVFRDLYKLDIGANISVMSETGQVYRYEVTEMYVLPEAGQPLEVRLKNAEYIQDTQDERLTLVTCHPYGSLRNRLIVIAKPAEVQQIERQLGE